MEASTISGDCGPRRRGRGSPDLILQYQYHRPNNCTKKSNSCIIHASHFSIIIISVTVVLDQYIYIVLTISLKSFITEYLMYSHGQMIFNVLQKNIVENNEQEFK